jgi:hypothetical protein
VIIVHPGDDHGELLQELPARGEPLSSDARDLGDKKIEALIYVV